MKVEAGALVFRIDIEVGADARHLDHGATSPGLGAAGSRHCHGCLLPMSFFGHDWWRAP